jgi:hypothetical protein
MNAINFNESECEKASLAYIISFLSGFVSLPLPIVNLLASFFYYIAFGGYLQMRNTY